MSEVSSHFPVSITSGQCGVHKDVKTGAGVCDVTLVLIYIMGSSNQHENKHSLRPCVVVSVRNGVLIGLPIE